MGIDGDVRDGGPVVITGGTGFLGLSLARYLDAHGVEVVLIARHPSSRKGNWTFVPWDGRSLGDWVRSLEGASGVVNLAGRSVDCIKTPEHRDEILRSRVESTLVLGKAMRQITHPPPVWVQMSTAHIYGDPPDVICGEDSAFGHGLAPEVGKAWEAALEQSCPEQTREVRLRTSFVLGQSGGAVQRLAKLARWGLGGTVGHGNQGISWIHEIDMNRLFFRALTDHQMRGAYLATAPHPESNATFMRMLRHAIGMPVGLPAMAWMVRIAAPLLLRTDPELALCGRYCVSQRLKEEGFEFKFPALKPALNDLFEKAN